MGEMYDVGMNEAAAPVLAPKASPGELDREFGRVEQAIMRLGELTGNLEIRLGPVMRPPSPEAVPSEPEDDPATGVGKRLRENRVQLEHMIRVLTDVEHRLEV